MCTREAGGPGGLATKPAPCLFRIWTAIVGVPLLCPPVPGRTWVVWRLGFQMPRQLPGGEGSRKRWAWDQRHLDFSFSSTDVWPWSSSLTSLSLLLLIREMGLITSILEGIDPDFRTLSSAYWPLFYVLRPSCAPLGSSAYHIAMIVSFRVCPSHGLAVINNFLRNGSWPHEDAGGSHGPSPHRKSCDYNLPIISRNSWKLG